MDTHLQGYCGKDSPRKGYWNWNGKKYRIWNAYLFTENQVYSYPCTWIKKKRWQERSRIWLPCGRNFKKTSILTDQHHFLTTCIWDALNVNANRTKRYCELADIKKQINYTKFQVMSKRRRMNQLKYAHKSCLNASILHELVGQSSYGQWTNLLDQSQNGHKVVADDWQDQFHDIHHTSNFRQYCSVLKRSTTLSIGFQDSDFAGTLRSRSPHRVEFCEYLEVAHLFLLVGCARSKHQYLTVPQNRKLFHWTLDCDWMVYLLSIFGMWW